MQAVINEGAEFARAVLRYQTQDEDEQPIIVQQSPLFKVYVSLNNTYSINNIGAIAACFRLVIVKAKVCQALKFIPDKHEELFQVKLKKAMEVVVSAAKQLLKGRDITINQESAVKVLCENVIHQHDLTSLIFQMSSDEQYSILVWLISKM